MVTNFNWVRASVVWNRLAKTASKSVHPFGWNFVHKNIRTDTHTQTDTQTNCSENVTPPRFHGGVTMETINIKITQTPPSVTIEYIFDQMFRKKIFRFTHEFTGVKSVTFEWRVPNCLTHKDAWKIIQRKQEAFRERRHLHVCDLWPWVVTLTLSQSQIGLCH